ncbi:MAG: GntR family transcriptional regulator [Candidatus Dormibacteraeota bacterium]|nr:GntR family transcriptional regulator [Candidatus Dormibacteraeota bacterium]
MPEISRSYLQDQVYQLIRRRIVGHTYGPGHRLSEAGMARELGVSRMPVRDALRRLQLEGLVEGAPGRGLVVSPISVAHARDVYHLRELLEAVAVELAAERATPADLERLEAAVTAQERATRSGTAVKVLRASMEFHDALHLSAHSSILSLVLEQIWAHARRYRELTLGKSERHVSVAEEHRALLEAIRRHDPEGAKRIIQSHVRGAFEVVAEQLNAGAAQKAEPTADSAVPLRARSG